MRSALWQGRCWATDGLDRSQSQPQVREAYTVALVNRLL